jgi:hypothetical protein
MKNLIKQTHFALYILLVAVITSCADGNTTTTKREGEAQQRIVGKEYTVYDGRGYQIIEIDGVEYVSASSGGICPLVNGN